MSCRAVGVSVVCHQTRNRDPVSRVEGNGSPQEADRGAGPLIAQDLDVGEAGGVIDADVDELPAGALGLGGALAGHPVTGALLRSAPAS